MPPAVRWYCAYCWLNAALNLALAAGAFWALGHWRQFVPDVEQQDLYELAVVLGCWMIAAAGLAFAAVNAALPRYRRGAAWPVHIVNIALGAGTLVLAPLCVPLLFAYFKEDVKAYYGGV